MRQLYIVNEVGTTYFFDFRSRILISDITDLGFEKENIYLEYKQNYKLVESNIPQRNIVFKLVFLDGYLGYKDFLSFLTKSKELRLFYIVKGIKRNIVVSFKSITKTELEANTIKSTLTLEKCSLWRSESEYSDLATQQDVGKIYPYRYPYTYPSSFICEYEFEVNGEFASPVRITLKGAFNNPIIEFYKGDELIKKVRVLVGSTSGTLEINSLETDPYIYLSENGVKSNVYSKQDFTYDNFIYLEKGSYKVKFIPGSNSETKCSLHVLNNYGGL